MAMAVPVVASRVSDLPSILEGCGTLVEPGDVDGLARELGALLADPQYAATLGRRARERCVAKFSYDAVAPALRAVVERGIAAAG
jgi:glycosyltransferase involved in cell wall biosynthesis